MRKRVFVAILLFLFSGGVMASTIKEIEEPVFSESININDKNLRKRLDSEHLVEISNVNQEQAYQKCLSSVYVSWVNDDGTTGAFVLEACGETYGEAGAKLDAMKSLMDACFGMLFIY